MRCPYCNALNSDDADWCNLCLNRLKEPPKSQQPEPPEPQPQQTLQQPAAANDGAAALRQSRDLADLFMHQSASTVPRASAVAAVTSEGDVIRRTGEGITWTCPSCGQANAIGTDICTTCGTPLFDAFRAPQRRTVPEGKSSGMAAALSVIPGLGHLYLGLTGEGIGRLALGLWWFGTALALSSEIPTLFMVKVLFIVATSMLAAVSAGEAYRAVESPGSSPLLTRRLLLYTSLSLLALLVLSAITGAFAARG